MKKISMETILGVLLFAGLGLLFTRGIQKTAGEAVTEEKQAAVTATVVIDAGHGGSDPIQFEICINKCNILSFHL